MFLYLGQAAWNYGIVPPPPLKTPPKIFRNPKGQDKSRYQVRMVKECGFVVYIWFVVLFPTETNGVLQARAVPVLVKPPHILFCIPFYIKPLLLLKLFPQSLICF